MDYLAAREGRQVRVLRRRNQVVRDRNIRRLLGDLDETRISIREFLIAAGNRFSYIDFGPNEDFADYYLPQAEVAAAFEALLFVGQMNDVLDENPVIPPAAVAANEGGERRLRRLGNPGIALANPPAPVLPANPPAPLPPANPPAPPVAVVANGRGGRRGRPPGNPPAPLPPADPPNVAPPVAVVANGRGGRRGRPPANPPAPVLPANPPDVVQPVAVVANGRGGRRGRPPGNPPAPVLPANPPVPLPAANPLAPPVAVVANGRGGRRGRPPGNPPAPVFPANPPDVVPPANPPDVFPPVAVVAHRRGGRRGRPPAPVLPEKPPAPVQPANMVTCRHAAAIPIDPDPPVPVPPAPVPPAAVPPANPPVAVVTNRRGDGRRDRPPATAAASNVDSDSENEGQEDRRQQMDRFFQRQDERF